MRIESWFRLEGGYLRSSARDKAPAVCDKLVEAIKSGKYDVIIINFANPDMVGYTGIQVMRRSRQSRR